MSDRSQGSLGGVVSGRPLPALGRWGGRLTPAARTELLEKILPFCTFAGLVLAYDLLVRTGVMNERYFPTAFQIAGTLWSLVTGPYIWRHVGATFYVGSVGLAIAAAIAIPLGLIAGRSALFYRFIRAPFEFLRPVPSIAFTPLVVLLWGPSDTSKIFVVAFASFFPLFLQSIYGVQDVDPNAIDTGRIFGLSRRERLVRIILPNAFPYIATALRIQILLAFLIALVAEVVLGGNFGLGNALLQFGQALDFAGTYAVIIFIGLIGIGLAFLFELAEKRILRWHPSHRTGA